MDAAPRLPAAPAPPVKLLDRLRAACRLRHSDVSTTVVYTPVLNKGGAAVRSPLDRL